MKIGVIQASSQKSKNEIIEASLREVVSGNHDVYNFGVCANDENQLSYIHIALCIGMLIESKAIDFIVTGCSSGQGMMLACNSFSGITCGYVGNVTDAYLFGRINNGNVISYPLGVNWGWSAEINLKETLKALFSEPFGNGYPAADASRKKHDTEKLQGINKFSKNSIADILELLDEDIVNGALNYDVVYEFIMENGINATLIEKMKSYKLNKMKT